MAFDMIPPDAAYDFLDENGWHDALIEPVAGDASFRRYFRVRDGERVAILMDAPPPHEDPRPYISVARWLGERGFRAPTIHAEDLSHGLVLIEDFGDARMRETVDAEPAREDALYAQAIDLLVALRAHPAAAVDPYDRATCQREAGLLTEWYCPAIGLDVDAKGYGAAWDAVLEGVDCVRDVMVLRDYHAENIMLLADGAIGLLDFQDALAGHPAYDLVSLLQDARRDVPEGVETAMLDRYRTATGEGDAFTAAYHVLGAQRNAKIIGIFTRLWRRDDKPRYPTLCPRVWRYLERDLAHPALGPVKTWFDANIPADMRGDPMEIAAR